MTSQADPCFVGWHGDSMCPLVHALYVVVVTLLNNTACPLPCKTDVLPATLWVDMTSCGHYHITHITTNNQHYLGKLYSNLSNHKLREPAL